MAVLSEHNTSNKVTEEQSKYKCLKIEINRMWRTKTIATTVVIGALGLVTKGLEKYTEKISGNINIHDMQNIALSRTVHKLRRMLTIK